MDQLDQEAAHQAAILNACYFVRHYRRGGRSTIQRAERSAAIRALGLAVRVAFNESENFEPLLTAVVHGLSPRDEPPAF